MGGRGRWGRRTTRRLEFNDTQLILTTVETVITHKPYERPLPPPDDLAYKGYELIASCWDGEKTPFYPMLPTDRAWSLVARQGDSIDDPLHTVHAQHRFGMSQPTLSWVNGAEVIEAYIDGMTTDQFCQTYGIDLAVTKSGFVTFKRLSRLFRDYRLSARLPDDQVRLEYLDLDSTGEIQWDGAGLISRAMLERLQISPHLPADQQARLREELKHIGRVEFTVNNSAGQHKGHAIVVDDMAVDFRVPRDIKKDVRLTDGTTFIGINAVHSDDRMRLDIQSIANLHPFFSTETMATYLKQHETLSDQAVISGAKGEGMARLNGATRRELDDQPKREYLASGGPATALPSLIDQCYSGAIENIEQNLEKGKLRIPVPGGRYYVMSGAVAQTAGLNLRLERGQVHLDPRTSTAWVHPDDWLSMQDSPNGQGIRDILGGADQDDALWVHGFTDHDGQRKVLAWRSPNNTGEYVILNPHAESRPLPWHTPEGETLIDPPGDSRQLPPRIDLTQHEGRTTYKHLVQDTQVGDLGQGQPYSVGLTGEVLQRTMTNKGVLGAYCNYVMAYKTATGQVPSELPCTMEEVVDADVKTGADLSQVKDWLEAANRRLISGGTPISTLIAPRVGLSLDDSGQVPRGKQFGRQWVEVKSTEGQHWSDALKQVVESHKKHLIEQRNTLMKAARLPNAVYDSVATDAVAQDAGARFNQTYARALKAAQETYGRLVTANPRTERSLHEKQQRRQQQLIRDYVREECEDVLRSYPDDQHTAILRGAMVSREMGEKKPAGKAGRTPKKASVYDELAITSDAALWQRGYIGQTTLKALREVEVIGEIVEETNAHGQRLVHYPPPTQVARQASYDQTPINMVWYNHLLDDLRRRGEPLPSSPSNVADAIQIQYKANVRHRARRSHEQGGYIGMPLFVEERSLNDSNTPKKLVFVDGQGRVFGMVNKKAHDQWQPGEEAVIRQAKPDHDGHLDVTIERRG